MFSFHKSKTGGPECLVVGLGNPGDQYRTTRHNMGFLFMDRLAEREKVSVKRLKFHALCGEATIAGVRCLLMKPNTFMNHSGEAVKAAADFYKIPPQRIIVVFDDVALNVGNLRIRRKGSAGGHNGIKSIIEHLGTEDFPRIKIAVGPKLHPEMDLADFVLGHISKQDELALAPVIDRAVDALPLLVQGKIDEAMNRFPS